MPPPVSGLRYPLASDSPMPTISPANGAPRIDSIPPNKATGKAVKPIPDAKKVKVLPLRKAIEATPRGDETVLR